MTNLNKMTVKDLRKLASELEIQGRSKMLKDDLVRAIARERQEQAKVKAHINAEPFKAQLQQPVAYNPHWHKDLDQGHIDSVALDLFNLYKWAEDKDEKGKAWARKRANLILKQYPEHEVRGNILPTLDDMITEKRRQELVADKVDNPETANLEAMFNDAELAHAAFVQMQDRAGAVAQRFIDKDIYLEEKTGVNRAQVDNRRYYHRRITDEILRLEFIQDCAEKGIISKEMALRQLASYMNHMRKTFKAAKLYKYELNGKMNYRWLLPRKGVSMTGLRALWNTAVTCAQELGMYGVTDAWYKRAGVKREFRRWNEKHVLDDGTVEIVKKSGKVIVDEGYIVIHEWTENNERQERSQEDWDAETAALFYQMEA